MKPKNILLIIIALAVLIALSFETGIVTLQMSGTPITIETFDEYNVGSTFGENTYGSWTTDAGSIVMSYVLTEPYSLLTGVGENLLGNTHYELKQEYAYIAETEIFVRVQSTTTTEYLGSASTIINFYKYDAENFKNILVLSVGITSKKDWYNSAVTQTVCGYSTVTRSGDYRIVIRHEHDNIMTYEVWNKDKTIRYIQYTAPCETVEDYTTWEWFDITASCYRGYKNYVACCQTTTWDLIKITPGSVPEPPADSQITYDGNHQYHIDDAMVLPFTIFNDEGKLLTDWSVKVDAFGPELTLSKTETSTSTINDRAYGTIDVNFERNFDRRGVWTIQATVYDDESGTPKKIAYISKIIRIYSYDDPLDSDNDGIPDWTDDDDDNDYVLDWDDNCPTIYNPNQEDRDDDGIGDACENAIDEIPWMYIAIGVIGLLAIVFIFRKKI